MLGRSLMPGLTAGRGTVDTEYKGSRQSEAA